MPEKNGSDIVRVEFNRRRRACFRSERAWNWQEQSRYFLRLATNAQRRLWRLKDAAVFDEESRADYDRALAVYSVCQRLWGQPFLREREMFVEQLDLRNVTLFAHDWGGAIGMGTAGRLRNRSPD